ncbi:hypothetical protein ACFB49_05550 [Sphingomonas sp. DBB INV C78]|uniref:peptidylprolyl isomerase n=1 Tax=Sphingomonas sp. DBB INV C78 TaxID=3349434 RepID=UPI0036D2CDD7
MKYFALLPAAALFSVTAAPAANPLTPSQILAAAPAGDWADVPAENLLVMDLAGGGRVAIELAPDFAPVHIANIRTLTRAAWFDGTSINRVQDNYVTQWGDATERKQLSIGTVAKPPAEYERPVAGTGFAALPYRDAYAPQVGHAKGWPAASDGKAAWLTHCYGMVGVGRNLAPDTGTGAELYTVIGHAPRHLDRNIAVVGRVVEGIEKLSALPRGTEALGVYARPDQRLPIGSIKLASDMPAAERPAFQVLRQGSPSFTAWVKARANRQDDFFILPAGAADICNLQAPVRRKP